MQPPAASTNGPGRRRNQHTIPIGTNTSTSPYDSITAAAAHPAPPRAHTRERHPDRDAASTTHEIAAADTHAKNPSGAEPNQMAAGASTTNGITRRADSSPATSRIATSTAIPA